MMNNLNRLLLLPVLLLCFFTLDVKGQSSSSEWSSSEIEEYFQELSSNNAQASLKSSSTSISLKGVRDVIADLDDSYCSNYGVIEIEPDSWDTETTSINWTIKTFVGVEETHSDWITTSGSGSSTVLSFYPDLVTSSYYGAKIYFYYEQVNDLGFTVSTGYDYTYVYQTPTAYSLVASDSELCNGESTTIVLQGSESGMSYQLKDSDDNDVGLPFDGNGGSITFTVTPSLTTVYHVEATNSTDNSCTQDMSNTVTIVVYDLPSPSASNDGPVCEGEALNIFENTGGFSSYSWSGPNSYTSSEQSPSIDPTTSDNAGTYTVTVVDSYGCTADASTTVVINTPATPIVSGDADVCVNESGVTYTTDSGMSNYVWDISGGTITSGSGTNEITVTWTTSGSQYVSVEYDDTNSCSSATPTVFSVNVNALPVPVITGSTDVCLNSTEIYTTESGMSNYSWTISGGTIDSGSSSNEVTVTWDTAGTGTLTVNYDDGNGCAADSPTSVSITVNDLPVPTISGSTDVCLNSTETYTTESGMSNYSWTVTGGTITSGSSSNSIEVTWTSTGTQTVSVSYEDLNGCSPSLDTDYSVTVNALPTPILSGDTDVCLNETGVIYTTDSGMSNYTWSVTGGTITSGSTSNTITVTWDNAGSGTVSVNYENSNGCSADSDTSLSVTVNDLPVPVISGTADVCLNSTETYTTDSGMSNYSWTVTGGTIDSGNGTNTVDVIWDTTGTGIITVSYDDTNGCSTAVPTSLSVTVNDLPVPTITGEGDVCLNETGVTYTTESGMSNYAWTVTGGTITSGSSTNSIEVTWTSTGTQTVSVSYTDTNNCDADAATDYTVTVNTLPVPTLSGSTSVCLNSTETYTTESGMSNYSWSVTGGTISNGDGTYSVEVDWDTSGTQSISVNYDNSNGCDADSPTALSVTVNDLPVPIVSGDANVCLNETATYTTDSGMLGYSWSVSGGNITSGSGTNSIDVSWDTAGSQTVSVSYTDSNGCTSDSPTSFNVTVNDLPVPTISGDFDVCENESSVTYTTESGMSNYVWAVTGGTIDSGSGTEEVTVTWGTAGSGSIEVSYEDANSCSPSSSTSATVTINSLPVPVISGSASVCYQSTETYTTDSGMSNYTWTVTGGSITSGDGTSSVQVEWTTEGTQSISVNYDNLNGCTAVSATSLSVEVNSLPVPVVSGSSTACINTSGYSYSTDAGNSNYVWTISGGTIDSGQGTETVSVTWDTVGDQTISVIYDDGTTGCTASAATEFTTEVIELSSSLSVSSPATGTTTICAGTSVTFNGAVSGGSGDYNYDFHIVSGGVDSSEQSGSSTTYTTSSLVDTDEIYVIITDNTYGCSATSASITMTVVDNPVPTLSISSSGGSTVCAEETVVFVASPSGYSQYVFYKNSTEILQDDTSNTLSINDLEDGDVVSVTVYSGDCTGTSTGITMTVNDLPTVTLSSDATTVCESETVNFTATGSGTGSLSYQFFVDGVSQQGPSTSNTFSWSSTSDYAVEVTVYDDNNCEQTSSSIDITISNPVAILSADQTEICEGDTISFTASGGDAYEFFVNSTSVQSGASNEYVTNALSNNDLVTVQVIDSYGCTGTNSGISVTVNPVPSVSLSSSDLDSTICAGDEVTFTASGDGDVFEFYVDDVSVQGPGSENEYTTTSLTDGQSVYVVVSYSTSGCSSTSGSITMTVNPLPIAVLSVSPSLSFISGTDITFTGGGGTEYAFYVNSSVVQSRSTSDTYITDTLEDGDVVTVYVYDGNNCMSYTSTTVTVYDGIVIYEVLYTALEYCEDDGGVSIYLGDTPQYGVTYELIRTSDDGQEGSSIIYDGTNTVRWDNVLGTEEYRIEAYYSAVPDEREEMNNRVSVIENTLPTVYDISPTGTVTGCNDGAGHVISVSGSESGVTYTLLLEGSEVETMAGTGSSIDFSAQLGVGSYTVTAENDTTGCTSDMNGSFEIEDDGSNVSFTVYAVDPALENDSTDGRYCYGDAGVEIALDGSLDTGVTYKLYLNGTDTGISEVGTGDVLSFGTLAAEGTYTVRVESSTGCEFLMDGYVDVSIIAIPTAFNVEVDNSGHYCQDGTGVYISLDDQEEDVIYNLYLNGTTLVDSQTGTDASGTSLVFDGPITTEGLYSVEAVVSEVGCSASMNDTVEVIMDSLPVAYDVTTDPGYYCSGSTTTITLSDSESDVEYSLYMITSTLVETQTGTGASLNFEVDTQGSYYIVGMRTDGISGCTQTMNDTVSITEVDLPDDKYISTVYYGSGCDDGDSIVVLATEEFVTYELVKVVDGSYYPADVDSIYGDGSDQGFEKIVDTNDAVYTVLATNSYGCSIYISDSVYVNVANVVEKQVVTGEGQICNGDSGVEFGLEDTESGVEYQLWRDGDSVYKESITGDGGVMTFTEVNEEGTYYVLGITTDCSLEMANRVTLTFYDLPIAYAMTGSGLSCDLTNDGAYVGLEATEEDVTYTLQYDDGSGVLDNIDPTVTGDASGDAIEWKVFAEGTYTVIAETEYGCTSSMNGSVYVVEGSTPTDYDVFADSYTYCDGDGGIELFIENNEIDVVYYIINTSTNDTIEVDGVNTDASVADTLSLGIYTAGTYEVVGVLGGDACETNMNGGATITIEESTSPQSYEVLVLDATICGSDSAVVYLDDYEIDREYRIEDSTGAILDTITSNDRDSIYWYVSDVSGSEIYEVIAISGGTCDLSMGTVEVTYSDGPEDFTISVSDTIYCEGSDSISVSIDLTESDVAYLLVESDDVSTALDVLIGNDTSQTFTKEIGEGSYLVRAILYSTGCEDISEDTINITKSPLPEILADTYCGYLGNSDCTVGDSICIDPSEEDVIYYLYDSEGVIDSVYADSGNQVCFPAVDDEGSFTIMAVSLNYPYCENSFDTAFDYSYSDYGSLVAVDDVFNVASGLTIDTCYARANDTLIYVYNSAEYVVPFDDFGEDAYFDTNSDEVNVIDKYYGNYEDNDNSANIEFHLLSNDDGSEVLSYANDTVGTFVIDQDYGSIVYTKTPGFYGKYTLYYVIENTDYEDRRDTASVSLYVGNTTVDDENSFLIPNAFSPNDDGINDYYVISGEEGGITATSSTLEVYNRWGTLVYRSDGTLYGEGDDWWDGTSTTSNMVSIGSDLPNGTYFYIFKVEINDEGVIKSKDYNGYIELRR